MNRFKEMYKSGFTPWDIGKADFNLVEVVTSRPITGGKALDIGCGTGDNSIWLAQNGFLVTGADTSDIALENARQKAHEAKVECRFVLADFLDDKIEGAPFDFAFDRGCFHSFGSEEERGRLAQNVASHLEEAGLWLTLVGNADEKRKGPGPPQRTAADIVSAVEPCFEILSLVSSHFGSNHPKSTQGMEVPDEKTYREIAVWSFGIMKVFGSWMLSAARPIYGADGQAIYKNVRVLRITRSVSLTGKRANGLEYLKNNTPGIHGRNIALKKRVSKFPKNSIAGCLFLFLLFGGAACHCRASYGCRYITSTLATDKNFVEPDTVSPAKDINKSVTAKDGKPDLYATMTSFVTGYLKANENKQLDKVLLFYGDSINYYSEGIVPKSYIVQDKTKFFGSWSSLKYVMGNDLQILNIGKSNTVRLIFTFTYYIVTSRRTIKGIAKNTWDIENAVSNPKIILEKQKTIKRETY